MMRDSAGYEDMIVPGGAVAGGLAEDFRLSESV